MASPWIRAFLVLTAGTVCTSAVGQGPGPSPTDLLIGSSASERGEPAAEPDRIETDRDSFTPTTRVVGRGRLVAESAYTFSQNRDGSTQHSFPDLLLRYGLTDRVEFRLGWNYEIGNVDVSGAGLAEGDAAVGDSERTHRISYGFKVGLTEQDGLRPESAFILQAATPTDTVENYTTLAGTYVFGWSVLRDWKWDSAVRYVTSREGSDHYGLWTASTVLKVPIGERWAPHVEYFTLATVGKQEGFVKHYISPGVHYLVTPDLEVGVRLGWGMNNQSDRFFTNVGLGLRY